VLLVIVTNVKCLMLFVTGKPLHHSSSHVDYVPSVFSFVTSPAKIRLSESLTRHHRLLLRRQRTATSVMSAPVLKLSRDDTCIQNVGDEEVVHTEYYPLSLNESEVCTGMSMPSASDASSQTDLTGSDVLHLQSEVTVLREQVNDLQAELQNCKFGVKSLQCDDRTTRFYTGLSFTMLLTLFSFLASHVKKSATTLPRIDEMFLVLVKLRLGLANEDLAHRFRVHSATVSKIFHKWLDVMQEKMGGLISWPDRESVRATLPAIFHDKFSKLVSIIDCTEIFIERPFGLKARAVTYSNYKKHNTVKYLIGITPTGSISFLSKGWGGRVTDDHITRNSEFFSNLLPDDLVMADRGFRLEDDLALLQCKLFVPAFTRGKLQLSAKDVEWSRTMSNVRIHVERVIGVLKNRYTILQTTLPITLVKRRNDTVPTVDKIMTVCCALCNLGETVVPE